LRAHGAGDQVGQLEAAVVAVLLREHRLVVERHLQRVVRAHAPRLQLQLAVLVAFAALEHHVQPPAVTRAVAMVLDALQPKLQREVIRIFGGIRAALG
jgi:hypothetical protein